MSGETTENDKNEVSEIREEQQQPDSEDHTKDTDTSIHLKPSNDTSDSLDDTNLATQAPFDALDSEAYLSGSTSVDDSRAFENLADADIPDKGATLGVTEQDSKALEPDVLENDHPIPTINAASDAPQSSDTIPNVDSKQNDPDEKVGEQGSDDIQKKVNLDNDTERVDSHRFVDSKSMESKEDHSNSDTLHDNDIQTKLVVADNSLIQNDSNEISPDQNVEVDVHDGLSSQIAEESSKDISSDQNIENVINDLPEDQNIQNGRNEISPDENVENGSNDEKVETDVNKMCSDQDIESASNDASPNKTFENSNNEVPQDQNVEKSDNEGSEEMDLEILFDDTVSDDDAAVAKQQDIVESLPNIDELTNQKPLSQSGSKEVLFDDSDDDTEMMVEEKDSATASMAQAVELALVQNKDKNGKQAAQNHSKTDKKRPSSDIENKTTTSSPSSKKNKVQTKCYLGNMSEWAEKMEGKTVTGNVHENVIRDRSAMNFWKEYPGGDDYPEGWIIHVHKRPTGVYGKHLDWYWFTASGKKLRSRNEITRFLEHLNEGKDEEKAWDVSATSSKTYKAANRDPKPASKIPSAKKMKTISKPEKKTAVELKKIIKKANQEIAETGKKKKKKRMKTKDQKIEADMKMPKKKTIPKTLPTAPVTQRVAEAKVKHTDGSPFKKLTSKKAVAPEEKMKSSKVVAPTIPSPERINISTATALHVTPKKASKARATITNDKSSKKTSSFETPTIAEAK